MVKHGIDIIKTITDHLNPGQITVIVCDQPLFTLTKYALWAWPSKYGKALFLSMMGGLHSEMNYWKLLGDLLDRSGWGYFLVESGIAGDGVVNHISM